MQSQSIQKNKRVMKCGNLGVPPRIVDAVNTANSVAVDRRLASGYDDLEHCLPNKKRSGAKKN